MGFFFTFFAAFFILLVWIWFSWRPVFPKEFYLSTPMFFGHRGALHRAPENTLSSYKAAIDAGLRAIEMDVVSTKDGKVVCSHNVDLERETDGKGFFNEVEWENLEIVRAGCRSHPNKTDRLYLLEEITNELPENIRLNIEIKSKSILDIQTAISVAKMIRSKRIKQKVVVSSFNPIVLCVVKWIDKNISTGFIIDEENIHLKWCMYWAHPDCLHPTAEFVDDALMNFAKKKELAVNVWTVNTKPAIAWLKKRNVHGIITDYPQLTTNF